MQDHKKPYKTMQSRQRANIETKCEKNTLSHDHVTLNTIFIREHFLFHFEHFLLMFPPRQQQPQEQQHSFF